MSYNPRPSQTRRGQAIEELHASTNTQRLRQLLLSETQDDWQTQREVNGEVEGKLTRIHERWQILDALKLPELAASVKITLRFHWIAIGVLATALGFVAQKVFK